jgi:hypothetical protein
MNITSTLHILADIVREREAQDKKWGEQHYPDGTNPDAFKPLADLARDKCDLAMKVGQLQWIDILIEETMETYAEVEWPKLRKELIQSAAVIVAWVEDGDSRNE